MARGGAVRRLGPFVVAALVPLAGCSGAPPYEPPPGVATAQERADVENRPRVVTFPEELARGGPVDIELHEAGYVALFELRPGRSLAMVLPLPGDVVRSDGRPIGVRDDANLLEAGLHRVGRPAPGADLLSYSYACRWGHRDAQPLTRGRWLLLIWSPDPFRLERLWGPLDEACATADPFAQADSVVRRITPDYEARRWKADLLEYGR